MRKPNPDPHPERPDEPDISPERIIWTQMERFLVSLHRHDELGIHGALSGLSALVSPIKTDGFKNTIALVMDANGFEERAIEQFESIVKLLDGYGKWLSKWKDEIAEGMESAVAFS